VPLVCVTTWLQGVASSEWGDYWPTRLCQFNTANILRRCRRGSSKEEVVCFGSSKVGRAHTRTRLLFRRCGGEEEGRG
jgi:hypothetical protein